MKLINSCKLSVQRFLTYLPSVSITTWPYLLFYMFAFSCFACVLLRTELLSFVKSKLVKQQLYSGDTSSTACKVSIPYSVVMSCCHIDLQICFRNICKQNQLDSHSLSLSLSPSRTQCGMRLMANAIVWFLNALNLIITRFCLLITFPCLLLAKIGRTCTNRVQLFPN